MFIGVPILSDRLRVFSSFCRCFFSALSCAFKWSFSAFLSFASSRSAKASLAAWIVAARVAGSSSVLLLLRRKPIALSMDVRDDGTVSIDRIVSPLDREVGRLVWETLFRRVKEEFE